MAAFASPGDRSVIRTFVTALLLNALAGESRAASSLDECWTNARSRRDLAPCLEQSLKRAEADLAAAEKKAAQNARSLDAETSRTELTKRLADSNRAWRRYRDAECARVKETAAGGSGQQDFYLACLVDLTRVRAQQLDR
jgi:uncharacterized protein YecT (DUF1311 family)